MADQGKQKSIVLVALAAVTVASAGFILLKTTGKFSLQGSSETARVSATKRYDAFGDSITLGHSFAFTVDESGKPQKSAVHFQGWPELVGEFLRQKTGVETVVVNKGYAGDRTAISRSSRLPQAMGQGSAADHALLLIGTNDSNDYEPTPSGKGCRGKDCQNTFRHEASRVVRSLQASGRGTVFVGILPPAWGASRDHFYRNPLDTLEAPRNQRIREFNDVIVNEIAKLPGVRLGPDFFTCFLSSETNRFSLFNDNLHPNTLGYVFMAALWRDVILAADAERSTSGCPAPVYILESLDSYAHGHKQNLLDKNDRYYTDAAFTLVGVPPELAAGIWVSQANADRSNRDADFLAFDAGEAPVTVYIAYDPAGSPPTSSSHVFSPIVLSAELRVSDAEVGAFPLVSAAEVTGLVRIGGNQSGTPPGVSQQGYVVIVVP